MARKKGTPRQKSASSPAKYKRMTAAQRKAQNAAAKKALLAVAGGVTMTPAQKKAQKAAAKKALRVMGNVYGRPLATSTPKQRRRAGRHPKMRTSKAKGKTCITLKELTQTFPDVAKRICFYPKVSSYKSVVASLPASKRKIGTWYKG